MGITNWEVDAFVIRRETTRRHQAQKDRLLTVEESDRLIRRLRLQTIIEGSFEDTYEANEWLRRPLALVGRTSPETGARLTDTILPRLHWGCSCLMGQHYRRSSYVEYVSPGGARDLAGRQIRLDIALDEMGLPVIDNCASDAAGSLPTYNSRTDVLGLLRCVG